MTTITGLAPPGLVQGAARTPIAYGLLPMVQFVTDGRWESGVEWETENCADAQGIGPFECDPEDTIGLPKNLPGTGQDIGEAMPFTVYGHHNCSPVGITPPARRPRPTSTLR